MWCDDAGRKVTMRQIKNIILGISAAAVLVTAGCASWQRDGDRSAGRVVDDRHINARVADKLSHEPVYKFSDVDVKTFNGVVQLSGFVDTEDQKNRAGELARSAEGVGNVVNSIALKNHDALTPTGRTNELNRPYINNGANRVNGATNTTLNGTTIR